ncbi:MAG: T9SS type A sorting domain-containing protein, partial [Muribaculaceae bacterium]|nr:T9SS type A sorting domain-containing protein [Muribaculaceae bacterium]
QADIFGDWREEVILHDGQTESDLIIFSTTIPSDYKVPCLMTDRQYREAIAWQNVAYNQPPHLSYNLESKFDTRSGIVVSGGTLTQSISLGDPIADIEFTVVRAIKAEVTGLPQGVDFSFDETTKKGIISGTPLEQGEWNFTITTSGSEDGEEVSLQGSITVSYTDKSLRSGYFSFDEIGASSVENNFNGDSAEIHGSVFPAKGVKEGAIEFDGSGYLTQPIYDQLQFGNNSFSIELWMKSTDDDGYLFCIGTHNKTNVTGGTGNWVGLERLMNASNDRLNFTIDDDVTKTDCSAVSPSDIFDGNWHQIVCVRNGEARTMSIYIDGKHNITNSNVGTGALHFNAGQELFFIGGDDEPTSGRENRTFNGCLDALPIYPFALSAEDVKANFDALSPSSVGEMAVDAENAIYSVIEAFSGRIVKTARGEAGKTITEGLEKGMYILMIERGSSKETRKFVKK